MSKSKTPKLDFAYEELVFNVKDSHGHGGDWNEWPHDWRVREFPGLPVCDASSTFASRETRLL